ncbi:MAG: hypothetical protein DI551_09225 [Micavibrio aeruginosavorus]|uniref:Bacteriophage Mu Gp45 N-terminal domain-containing protein n=1 Tax=Micavibrio aeruginosavorus TaxID=349221 RepID=A0A2W5MUI9_9BACT|nr:MAG: hypothetical protein DI551_09225 [Micavibrio aeruginosavorus]
MTDGISKYLDPLKRRIYSIASRGTIKGVSDGGGRQYAQVGLLAGESRDNVERIQNFGLSSNPPAGTQAVVICVGGNRDHPIIIATDNQAARIGNLKSGETVIYNAAGDFVKIEIDGKITIKASSKVRVEAPLMECTGDIIDNCDNGGLSMKQMREIYNTHTHKENDNAPAESQAATQKMEGA